MKTIIKTVIVLLITLFFIGCQNNFVAKLEAENIETVKQYWTAWNSQDIETIKELYDKEQLSFSRSFEDTSQGNYEQAIEIIEWNFENLPNAKARTVDLIADKNKIITMGIYELTYSNDVEGWPPAKGQEIKSSFYNMMKLRNGKIIREIEIFDVLKAYQQMGRELKPLE